MSLLESKLEHLTSKGSAFLFMCCFAESASSSLPSVLGEMLVLAKWGRRTWGHTDLTRILGGIRIGPVRVRSATSETLDFKQFGPMLIPAIWQKAA